VIRGFIEQEKIRRLHQCLDDGEALLPASGQRSRFHFEVFKTSAAEGFCKAGRSLGLVDFRALHGVFCNRSHRRAGQEF